MRARGAWGTLVVAMAILTGVSACGGEDQRTDSVTRDVVRGAREDLDSGLVALLDSGNVAIRADEPAAAVEFYRRALDIDASSAAAWFGIYMASEALGRGDEAAEALDRARDLAPGASLLDPDTLPR